MFQEELFRTVDIDLECRISKSNLKQVCSYSIKSIIRQIIKEK